MHATHLQLFPAHPRGIAVINRARRPRVISCGPQPDTTLDTFPRWTRVPERGPLSFLWVLRSRQRAEIAPDLHATAAEKRDSFDRLQRRRYRPHTFHLSGNLEHKDLLKSWGAREQKGRRRHIHHRLCWCQCAWTIFNPKSREFSGEDCIFISRHKARVCACMCVFFITAMLLLRKCAVLLPQCFQNHHDFPYCRVKSHWPVCQQRYRSLKESCSLAKVSGLTGSVRGVDKL